MVIQLSNRHIQAVVNNVKLIILDYLATKKSGILGWRFLWLILKQLLFLDGNALQTSYRVQYAQG